MYGSQFVDPFSQASRIRGLDSPFNQPLPGPQDPTQGGARFPTDPWASADPLQYPDPTQATQEPDSDDERPDGDEPLNVDLVLLLVQIAAFCKELELQSHVIHLNFAGPAFLSLHAYLKERYQAHQEQFDSLAELVLTSGSLFPLTSTQLQSVCPPFQDLQSPDPTAMCAVYRGNLDRLAALAIELEKASSCSCAPDVANYAAELLADARKASWFLAATAS